MKTQASNEPQLTPCRTPGCAGTQQVETIESGTWQGWHYIHCDGCDCETPKYPTADDAITSWNEGEAMHERHNRDIVQP